MQAPPYPAPIEYVTDAVKGGEHNFVEALRTAAFEVGPDRFAGAYPHRSREGMWGQGSPLPWPKVTVEFTRPPSPQQPP